jgi:hypothetical protein
VLAAEGVVGSRLDFFNRDGAALIDDADHHVIRAQEKYRESDRENEAQCDAAVTRFFSVAMHASILTQGSRMSIAFQRFPFVGRSPYVRASDRMLRTAKIKTRPCRHLRTQNALGRARRMKTGDY